MKRGRSKKEKKQIQRNFNGVLRELPRFDFDKYEEPFEEEGFEVEEASEELVIDGIVKSGCPFSFLIDQINFFGH